MTTRAVSVGPVAGMLATAGDYFKLTKPRVISLLLVTTAAAMFVAAQGVPDGWLLLWTMVGGYLAAGGAGAINHYVDRDIDAYMGGTTGRPWWPGGCSRPARWRSGSCLGALRVLVLGIFANWLNAVLLAGLAIYVGVYTLWLNGARSTTSSSVGRPARCRPRGLGGRHGRPRSPGLDPLRIIFFWTPPTSGPWPSSSSATTRRLACRCCRSSA